MSLYGNFHTFFIISADIALLRVASCLGISSSMKGELGIKIKFLSFLLYLFLASLNNFLILIKYRESERLEGTRLPCCINLLVRISRSLFKNDLKSSKKSRVIRLISNSSLPMKRTKALMAVV